MYPRIPLPNPFAFRITAHETGTSIDFEGRYCVEYAIALLALHVGAGHIGPTIEVGFGDMDDTIIVLHAIVHTLGEDDSTGRFRRGYLQDLCVRWRDAERSDPRRTSSDISYFIESFRSTEDLRDRLWVLRLRVPPEQGRILRAKTAILDNKLL